MIRRARIVTLAAVAAVLLVGAFAYAQGPGAGGFRGRGPWMGGPGAGLPVGQLGLTEAQRAQVRQLVQRRRTEMRPLMVQVRSAQEVQRQAVETLPVDEARIRAAAQELAQAQGELAVQQARLQSEVYALLTPEQQERARQVRAERDARVRERRSRQ